MSVKHTDGPWKVNAQATANNYIVLKDNNWLAAIQFNGELMVAKQDANARLIAAAPEMLTVLKKAYAKLADISHDWKGRHTTEGQALLCDMRDSIAKATNTDPETVQDHASKVQA